MGESLISRGATIGSASGGNGYVFITEIITNNIVWVAPGAQNQQFSVRIFGGGGAGYVDSPNWASGGGSGWMNNDILTIPEGSIIPVSIGCGGIGLKSSKGGSGGTTTFGSYLSANGGSSANNEYNGGHGGSGGGCIDSYRKYGVGGNGYQFGGGGGAFIGGKGGLWGGGGGSGNNKRDVLSGGTYGGSGGNNNTQPTNGTNTLGYSNIEYGARGPGLAGSEITGGGGGYGGCGGKYIGGGGGYGGNGGTFAGGGGGYMGHGGDNGGGGGGYGNGGSGMFYSSYTPRSKAIDGGYGAGGAWQADNTGYTTNWFGGNGGDGICIIQYYKAIQQNSFTMYQ